MIHVAFEQCQSGVAEKPDWFFSADIETLAHSSASYTTYETDSATFTKTYEASAIYSLSPSRSAMPSPTTSITNANAPPQGDGDPSDPRQVAKRSDDAVADSISTSVSTTAAESSTDSNKTSTATPKLYAFSSKYNTSLTTFKDYVEKLDKTAGNMISSPHVPWQGYQTNLTEAQVAAVKAQPWLS
ncbi:Uu.00g049890.m01.CDS01 [Anthostomella pinea]|uniref:Uu.00g049890.m01.CDS01 n=1 Tax=Anthostomella pinea TaxID=933095 RepID=A0AAI8VD03_9PEZI|nr:Uu.00g049890.m01.CDS01 [Anthostomella pinea]